ncbi:MAG: dTDP-4-dehydrorhamnose reductase [Thalassobaculales bacterium]
MRVLVTGAGGQVGRALLATAWPPGWRVAGATRAALDVTAPDPAIDADIVVNCAAYTAVDRAEADAAAARLANAVAPARLAAACARTGAVLIQLSTDYVFDGTGRRPYREDDPVNPLSVYGATKEAGERAVRAALERHVILRTSWVYDATGSNFLNTMLRLFRERPRLTVVDDQHGAPTLAADIAAAIAAIARQPGAWGTYHFTAAGETTWHGFATAIRDHLGSGPEIAAIPSSAYPTPARRPLNSRLDCTKVEAAFAIARRPWQAGLAAVMKEKGL